MPKELQLQKIEKAKGRPMLQWVGKKPLERVEYYPAQEKEIYGDKKSEDFNKLFWGDNLQVLAHLLKEYRGKIDLIYIDPPFDSKADYVKKVKVRGEKVEGQFQGLLEEKQYSDIWEKDEYIQFMYERLLLMKELLSDSGSIFLHCDWHKGSYLRLIMDEIFGENNFVNEIIVQKDAGQRVDEYFPRKHDTILFYSKDIERLFFNSKSDSLRIPYSKTAMDMHFKNIDENGRKYREYESGKRFYADEGKLVDDVWVDISGQEANSPLMPQYTGYPTQKAESLLKRIIEASTKSGSLVADFFMGSGTTCAVAQKLGRKWIGCDINLGAIQTATKRLNKIIEDQEKENQKLIKEKFKGSLGFKIYNVNDYDIFKNELEAKEIIMEMYGIEPIKRSYFDGVLDNNFVKVMPLNRVLNKLDIRTAIKNIEDKIDAFNVKKKSKTGDAVYEESVLIISSGMELDVLDFAKKENKTGVKIEIRDILTDKKSLIFKKKPEAKIEARAKDGKLLLEIKEFYSPILMRKLEIENEKALKKEYQAKVEDFRQIIDSVAIDVDYTGKLFNAEIIDLPNKRELIKAKYSWEYSKKGKYTVAVKIVDVLGEEYFETFEINV